MREDVNGAHFNVVLIVDDDPLIGVMMSQAFAEAGYEPWVAANAKKALEVLELAAKRIQLVVTDIQMPGAMDGIDFGHLVAERYEGIPVITMTGYAIESRRSAVGPVLHKPFAMERLLRVAKEIVANGCFWRQMMKPVPHDASN